MASPPGAADVGEAEAFLAAHPEIVAIDAYLIDANGIGGGKLLRWHEVLPVYRSGRFIPGPTLGLDVVGEDVAATGLVWAQGDADHRAWPVAGSIAAMPWTKPARGQFQLMLHDLDGAPHAIDSRQVLARQQAAFLARGLRPACAFELDFCLLDRERDAHGAPMPARLPVTDERPIAPQVYGLDSLDRLEPFVSDVYAAAAAHSIPLDSMISEYALGQYELMVRHRADALRAADDLVQLKRLLRGIAARHGMLACFMAKPYGDRAGSGMHIYASLDDTARSRCACRRARPRAGSLEHRAAGVDANPYLVAATVLAGIARGMEGQSDPGPPVDGSGYDGVADGRLPPDWRGAIEDAERSAFLREALGPRMADVLIAIKRAEYVRFASKLTEAEYELLETV